MTSIDTTDGKVRRHQRHFLARIAARLEETSIPIADARRIERPWLRWMRWLIEAPPEE